MMLNFKDELCSQVKKNKARVFLIFLFVQEKLQVSARKFLKLFCPTLRKRKVQQKQQKSTKFTTNYKYLTVVMVKLCTSL